MKILGISGSLRRDSYNTMRSLRNAAARVRAVGRAEGDPALRRGRRRRAGAAGGRAAARGRRRRRRDPLRDARVQRLDPRPAQERASTGSRARIATSVLRNKPVAVVGASTGAFGAVWAQAELRKVLADGRAPASSTPRSPSATRTSASTRTASSPTRTCATSSHEVVEARSAPRSLRACARRRLARRCLLRIPRGRRLATDGDARATSGAGACSSSLREHDADERCEHRLGGAVAVSGDGPNLFSPTPTPPTRSTRPRASSATLRRATASTPRSRSIAGTTSSRAGRTSPCRCRRRRPSARRSTTASRQTRPPESQASGPRALGSAARAAVAPGAPA